MRIGAAVAFRGLLAPALGLGLLAHVARRNPRKGAAPAEPGDRSDAVITPPQGIDPKMQVRPPPDHSDKTPVILPLGVRVAIPT
jgi:hypothetical protein